MAPRLLARKMTRSAQPLVYAVLAMVCPMAASSDIVRADYTEPTERYAHGVLGDAIEHGSLRLSLADGGSLKITLPHARVFEDTTPRLSDLDGDGDNEVIVVESHQDLGAQLAIYDETGKIAATPHIGRSNRWLAPIGAADLDGDGVIEVAYIDRPHLAKTLRVWRFENNALTHVADLAGLTNHRIGERDIGGGIRTCGPSPEMITANANWQVIMATTLKAGKLSTTAIAPHTDRASLNATLACN